jgi:hypothetical protein
MTVISGLSFAETRGPAKSSLCFHITSKTNRKEIRCDLVDKGKEPIVRSSEGVNEALLSTKGDNFFFISVSIIMSSRRTLSHEVITTKRSINLTSGRFMLSRTNKRLFYNMYRS